MRNTAPPSYHCQHLHFGRWPCPWPDCPKGVTEEEICDEGITVRRERWSSFDGGEYFSWEEPGVPLFGSVIHLTLRELQRRLHPSNHPTIYHYTNINGLQGILDARAIWLTDYAYLNDAKELRYGLDLARKLLQKLLHDSNYTESRQLFEGWLEDMRREPEDRIFLACFSMDRDNLSQWRSYGGIALGLRTESGWPLGIFRNEEALGYSWDKVIYDPEQQRLAFRILADHSHQALKKDVEEFGEQIRADYCKGARRLYRFAAFFKAQSFRDEKEARVVVTHAREGPAPAKLRFRPAGSVLVPYVVSSDLVENKPDYLDIHEIVVGPQPNQDLVIRSVKRFLAEHGYPKAVNVRKSQIPFRQMGVS